MYSRRLHLFLGLLFIASGCRERRAQVTEEHESAYGIATRLTAYEWEHPGVRVTNMIQVFEGWNRPYPYSLHRKFESFGKHAGFENSFYEKYVFLPPGITNHWVQGEFVLINAKPFPDARGELGRIIISKVGNGYAQTHRSWYPEFQVQQIFNDAGIEIPKPPKMPKPPPAPPGTFPPGTPLNIRLDDLFEILAEHLGMDGKGWVLRNATCGVILAATTFFGIVLWRRSRIEKARQSE